MNFKIFYFLFLIVPLILLIKNQIIDLKITDTLNCLNKFKSNNLLGFLILINILIGKLI